MRLGYLFSRFPVISQTFCLNEMVALERQGVEIAVGSIHPPQNTLRHEQMLELRAPVHYAPPAPVLKTWQGLAEEEERWPEELIEAHLRQFGEPTKAELRARNALPFARWFRQLGIGHCHVHFANRATHTALFVRELAGIGFSFTVHGQDFLVDLGNDDLLREMCERAAFIVTVSDHSRALLAQRCPAAAEKIHRVYNGIDLRRFAARTGARPARSLPRIVAVGRLIPFKGFGILVRACGLLHKRGAEFECEIVGEGPTRDELEGLIAELGLGDTVHLAGALSQQAVARKLAEADLFTLPSLVDARGASDILPTVILEAMAAGLPVVSTRIGGIPEMVDDEETGVLVAPGDPAQLADAIGGLLDDRRVARRMGRTARKIVAERFDIDKTVTQLRTLFETHPGPAIVRGTHQAPGWAVLCHRWPVHGIEDADGELAGLRRAVPAARLYVCRLARQPEWEERWDELAIALDYLPDATVIESIWQENRDLAHLVEGLRPRCGSELPGDDFFQQARYAVYLAREVRQRGIRHLHAFGSGAFVCAWMVRQLCHTGVSATLEETQVVAGATLRRLAADARAVATGEARAKAWGAPFVPRARLCRRALLDRLRAWDAETPTAGPLTAPAAAGGWRP